MNPLTLVKRIQSINSKEADLGIPEEASWHAKYRDSAYVFIGGIPYDLTEGDLLAVFSQYGEVVDINLIRDKTTGKSKGFAFLAYEDQRSTTLAVDNLNGSQVLGRIIRVDHCSKYVKREEEDEETQRQKREARGVCRAFQRGECTRGASCKFSHDEKRAANTGWGQEEDRSSRWDHDKFDGRKMGDTRYGDRDNFRSNDKERRYREKDSRSASDSYSKESGRKEEMRVRRRDGDDECKSRGDHDENLEKRPTRDGDDHEREPWSRDAHDGREGRGLPRNDDNEDYPRSRDRRDWGGEKRSGHRDESFEKSSRGDVVRREEKRLRRHEVDGDYRKEEEKFRRRDSDELESRSRRERDGREEKGSRRQSESSLGGDREGADSKRSSREKDSAYRRHRER